MTGPTIGEQGRAYIAERTGLSTATIEAVLDAQEEFWATRYPDLAEAARVLLEAADGA